MRLTKSSGKVLDAPMQEGSGSVAGDTSRYSNDGTITNASWGDNGVLLNGTTGYIDLGSDISLDLTTNITIMLWARQENDNSGHIIIKGASDDSKRQYGIYANSIIDKIYLYYYDGVKKEVSWNYSLDADVWHHLALTINNTTAKLYADGVLIGTETLDGNTQSDSSANLTIGRRSPANEYFSGEISSVKILNYTASLREIAADYNARQNIVRAAQSR